MTLLERPKFPRIALLGALGALFGGCADSTEAPPAPAPPLEPPNVVLAVLDTVRADHVSCYGYERRTTPAIDALAATADRYAVARSTSSWTLPSHASMMTGLYPFHHGAQARVHPKTGDFYDALPLGPTMPTGEPMPTLAEVLSGEGYQTAAVVANGGYLGTVWGLNRGFAEYSPKEEKVPRRGPDVNRLAIELLERRDPERPFFLFLNYMDAHRPYNVAELPPERAAALPPPDPENPQRLLSELVLEVLEEPGPLPAKLVGRVITQYDYGIAHADLAIENLIAWLKSEGEWDNTLFIVTSDHGEFLGEHDLVEHSKDIYEEGLRVPLIVRRPGQTVGRVIAEPTSVVDVPCLVVSNLTAELSDRLAGTFRCSPADHDYAEIRYTRPKDLNNPTYGHRFQRERTVLYSGSYKFIRSTDGRHELYDLEADPREQNNLFRTGDERSGAFLFQVDDLRDKADRGVVELNPVELDEAQMERLKALGYVDGGDGDDE